jgi:hypothetical protein
VIQNEDSRAIRSFSPRHWITFRFHSELLRLADFRHNSRSNLVPDEELEEALFEVTNGQNRLSVRQT